MPTQAPSSTNPTGMTGNVSADYQWVGGTMVPRAGQWSPGGVPIGYQGLQQQQAQASARQAQEAAQIEAEKEWESQQLAGARAPYEQTLAEAQAAKAAEEAAYLKAHGSFKEGLEEHPQYYWYQFQDTLHRLNQNITSAQRSLENVTAAFQSGQTSAAIYQPRATTMEGESGWIAARRVDTTPNVTQADVLFAQAHPDWFTEPKPESPSSPETRAYMQQVGTMAYYTGKAADILANGKERQVVNFTANFGTAESPYPFIISKSQGQDLSAIQEEFKFAYYDLAKTEPSIALHPNWQLESLRLSITGPGGYQYQEEIPKGRFNELWERIAFAKSKQPELELISQDIEVAGKTLTVPIAGGKFSAGLSMTIPAMNQMSTLSVRGAQPEFLDYFKSIDTIANLRTQAITLDIPTTSVGRGTATTTELFDIYIGQPIRDTALREKIAQSQYEAYRYFQTDTAYSGPIGFVTDVNAALSAQRREYASSSFPWSLISAGLTPYQVGFNIMMAPVSGISLGVMLAGSGEKFLTSPRVFTEDIFRGMSNVPSQIGRAYQLDPIGTTGLILSSIAATAAIGATLRLSQAKAQATQAAKFESVYKERIGELTQTRQGGYYSVKEAIITEKDQFAVRASAKFEPIFSYWKSKNLPSLDTSAGYVLRPSSVLGGVPSLSPINNAPSSFVLLPERYTPWDIQFSGLQAHVSGSVTTPTFFGLSKQTTWTEAVGKPVWRAWTLDVTPGGSVISSTPEGMISLPAEGTRETIFEMADRLTRVQYAQPFRSVVLSGKQYSFFIRGEEYAQIAGGGEMLTIPSKINQQFIGIGDKYNLLYELKGTPPKISSEPISLFYATPAPIAKTSLNVFDKGGSIFAENQISNLLRQIPKPQLDILKSAALASGTEQMVLKAITKDTGHYLLSGVFVPIGVYQTSPAGQIFTPVGAYAKGVTTSDLAGPLRIQSPFQAERVSDFQQSRFNQILTPTAKLIPGVMQPERQLPTLDQPQASRFVELNLSKEIITQPQAEQYIQTQASRTIENILMPQPQALRVPEITPSRITPPLPPLPPMLIPIPSVLGPKKKRKKEHRPIRFTLNAARPAKAYVPDIISQWISQNRYGKVTFPTQKEQAKFSARNAGYVPTKEMIQRGAAKEKYPRFTGFGSQFSAAAGKFRIGSSTKRFKTSSHKNPLTGLFRKK